MQHHEIVISGFGGQGVLFTGELLALAAMKCGLETTWFPSYGPEMRGGTAHCSVVIADEPIGSPLFEHPDIAIILNLPSLDKYEQRVCSGGLLVLDSSMVNRQVQRPDIKAVSLPATEMAESLGLKRAANVVVLGALLRAQGLVSPDSMREAIKEMLKSKRPELAVLNLKAFEQGLAVN